LYLKYTKQSTTSPEMSQPKAPKKHFPKTEIPLQMDLIRESFDVDPASKTWLRWKIRPRIHFNSDGCWRRFNARLAGQVAGWEYKPRNKAYFRVGINGRKYHIHRIVYALTHGVDPSGKSLDHIDGDGLNNNPINLRLATQAENGRNRGKNQNNTSGRKGVYWHSQKNKWASRIKVDGRNLYLGIFCDIESASAAYEAAAREHFGEFYRPS
jgi:hypothetical protein